MKYKNHFKAIWRAFKTILIIGVTSALIAAGASILVGCGGENDISEDVCLAKYREIEELIAENERKFEAGEITTFEYRVEAERINTIWEVANENCLN